MFCGGAQESRLALAKIIALIVIDRLVKQVLLCLFYRSQSALPLLFFRKCRRFVLFLG